MNPTTGSAQTDASGVATFTYTGNNPGDDTITACYEQTDTPPCEALASATKTWTAPETTGPTVDESSEPPTVTSGNNVLQTFTVTNTSDVTETNVGLAITFPAGATVLSSNPEQGTCTAGPATLTCSLGTIASGATVTIPVTVQVPAGFPPGLFAPSADVSSDQSGTGSAGPLPGSTVVAPTGGEASGYVPPGGTITTGDATPANPTAAQLHAAEHRLGCADLAHDGGEHADVLWQPALPGPAPDPLAVRWRLRRPAAPAGAGHQHRQVGRAALRSGVPGVGAEGGHDASRRCSCPTACRCGTTVASGGTGGGTRSSAAPRSRCRRRASAKRYFDRNGDSHVEILVLQGDPKFGRR